MWMRPAESRLIIGKTTPLLLVTSSNRKCRSVVEATVAAIVSCLFKMLTGHANPEVLDSATTIVRKAQAMRVGEIDSALYDEAKIFVLTWPKTKKGVEDIQGKGYENGENPSATDEAAPASPEKSSVTVWRVPEASEDGTAKGLRGSFERFEPLVMAVLDSDPGRQAQQPEHIRKSRVALAVASAERNSLRSLSLAAILDTWTQTERSRPLREDIERARLAN